MTSTDELRKLLDERGVKWREGEDERKTHWVANGLTWEYFNNENGDSWLGFLGVCESDVTPEQAIVATLGRKELERENSKLEYKMSNMETKLLKAQERIDELITAATLESGTLTADQVREAVMSADRWEKPMSNTGLTNTHLVIRDDGWQAIADELNAELNMDRKENEIVDGAEEISEDGQEKKPSPRDDRDDR